LKLSKLLGSEADKFCKHLSDNCNDSESYAGLSQSTLAKIILFNRKRQGEVAKTKLIDWNKSGKADINSDVSVSLSEFERGLLSVLHRMEIKGERGRTVPVILTDQMMQWLRELDKCRCYHIPDSNMYLFATASPDGHYRGSDVLRKFVGQCGASKPQTLTTTNFRKHVASLSQVLSLQPHEMEGLATFLGHDLRVHTEFYRLPLDTLQIAKVSKVFLAADQGRIAEFAGKSLDDIVLDQQEEVSAEANGSDSSSADEEQDCSSLPVPPSGTQADIRQPLASDSGDNRKKSKKTRSMPVRRKWTESEK